MSHVPLAADLLDPGTGAAAPDSRHANHATLVNYGREIEAAISALRQEIEANTALNARYPSRWLAVSLLEGDADLEAGVAQVPGGDRVIARSRQLAAQLAHALGEDVDTLIADGRYRFIADLIRDVVVRPASGDYTHSDRIDRVVTHPWFGLPIFLILMWFVFQMTANVSSVYLDWIDGVITGPLTRWVVTVLDGVGLQGSWFESLLVEGIITGAGAVLAFVPVVAFLYFFIVLLENTGYMARAAVVMDRFMQFLGLHGKSFIPLLLGFGCSVPGIYATRTLEQRRDRILTGLLVPFMSCAARLPVFVLIGTAFFGANSGSLVFAMYLTGIGVALLTGGLLQRTLFKQSERMLLVMELPPFRRPSFREIGRQVGQRAGEFVRGVWTVIMAASVIVWALLNIPYRHGEPPEIAHSFFGDLNRAVAPVFEPAGFGTWQASGSLMAGLVAKEVVISTMGQVYGTEAPLSESNIEKSAFLQDVRQIVEGFGRATWDTIKATVSVLPGINLQDEASETDHSALQSALREHFTPLQAVAFSVFVLLYTPCMATVAAIRHEFGYRWAWFSGVYMLVVAWLAAVLVYQVGRLIGLG